MLVNAVEQDIVVHEIFAVLTDALAPYTENDTTL